MAILNKISGFWAFLQKKFTVSLWQVALLLIVGIIIFLVIRNSRKESIVANPNQVLVPVVAYKDKQGNKHAQIPSVAVTDFGKIGDSLKRVIKDKNAKIKELTILTQKIDTTFKEVPIYLDTVTHALSFNKSDNYISIIGRVDTKKGTAELAVASVDTITYVSYTKNPLLRSRETAVDIKNVNPYSHFEYANSLHIVEQRPIIVFGPQVGVLYNGKVLPYVGAGITFNLFSIKTRK